jgi:hypothetical protein
MSGRYDPTPNYFRSAIFNFTPIQTVQIFTEDEVLQINLIIKRRAYRYIAGAHKEWLYPEKHVSTDHWKNGRRLSANARTETASHGR